MKTCKRVLISEPSSFTAIILYYKTSPRLGVLCYRNTLFPVSHVN